MPTLISRKIAYGSTTTVTVTNLASLASSSTWVAGRSLTSIVNTSALMLDGFIGGKIRVGTTPTANTAIEVWVIPKLADGNWPDVFAGTDAAKTVTTRTILQNYGGLLGGGAILVDTNTTGRDYPFQGSILQSLGYMPAEFQLFVTHNTAVNLDSTAGNFSITYQPIYETMGP